MEFYEKIQRRIAKPAEEAPLVISFFGDSVTEGCFELYKTKEGYLNAEYNQMIGYPYKLKKIFDTVFPPASVNILNAGVSGDNSVSGAKRLKISIIDKKPDLCIVCYGLNDAAEKEQGLDKYVNSLKSIFSQLKEADIETIFMTPNMMSTYVANDVLSDFMRENTSFIPPIQTEGIMDLYMNAAVKTCREEGIPVCDCYSKWKILYNEGADITRLLSNRLNHPTDEMHWLFAWSLFEKIMKLNGGK